MKFNYGLDRAKQIDEEDRKRKAALGSAKGAIVASVKARKDKVPPPGDFTEDKS